MRPAGPVSRMAGPGSSPRERRDGRTVRDPARSVAAPPLQRPRISAPLQPPRAGTARGGRTMEQPTRAQGWFLSYHTSDADLAEALETRLRARFPDLALFYAPKSIQAGGYWLPR